MSKQERQKFTATPEKPRPEKPLVQLTEDQLEAIALRALAKPIAGRAVSL